MDNTTLADELDALGAKATKGPWEVFYYDAGDKTAWDNCPSIQAPESEDCAVIHWDGFKQEYWTSANGDQRQIDGNAALIVALRNNLPTILAALRTPAPAPVSGNVAVELGWDRGMLDAAAICGALAETDFDDDADGFEAATGCASAIIRDLQKRRSNRTALQAQPAPAQGDVVKYLIRKGGYYYRPNAAGYTVNKADAGRYTLDEAIAYSHPNGPDGPRDGISYELDDTRLTQPQPDAAVAVEQIVQDVCDLVPDYAEGDPAVVEISTGDLAVILERHLAAIRAGGQS